MSLTQDEKNEIRRENPTYPRVSRTTDPMVVRIDKTSLLVNDTMFTAKLKCGLGYKGYLIYSSGLGTPIYEKAAKTTAEWQKSFSTVGNRPYNIAFDSENTSQLTNVLTAAAKEWLDDLEIAIADRENDNAIKKAIDRLCWQLHYDITESHTNFVDVFGQDDFSDVQIDRYPMDTEYWDGTTLKTSISDVAGLEFGGDQQPRSYEITYKGYFYESSERLKAFDDHLTTGTYKTVVVDDKTVVTKGSLMTVFDEHLLGGMYDDSNQNIGAIKIFDDHLLKNSYDSSDGAFKVLHTKLQNLDDNMNGEEGSLIKIGTKLVPDGANYYSISECLRDENEYSGKTYSIARSLREGTTQTSVSQATYDQTVLEDNKFTEISDTKLGDFGSAGHKTLYATLGEYTDSTKNNLSEAVGYTTGDISMDEALGVTSGNTGNDSIADRIGNTGGQNGSSIADRLGVFNVVIGSGDTRRYRSLFDTINNGRYGYSNPDKNSLKDSIGIVGNGEESIASNAQFIANLMKPSRYGGTGFVDFDGSGDAHFYVRTSGW